MDNKELQKTVNPIYLTAKATLSLLNKVKDPDAVALMQYIGNLSAGAGKDYSPLFLELLQDCPACPL